MLERVGDADIAIAESAPLSATGVCSETHPVMRSVEPGEAWRWCFVHELVG